MLLGVSGTREGLDQVPDGIYQRAHKMNCVELHFKDAVEKMGRKYINGRAGVTTDGVLGNKYRAKCLGRGRCSRGCDIGATFHSPTALIFPARDSGKCTVRPYSVAAEVFLDPETGRAGGVRVIDANTRQVMDFKAKVVVLGAGCLDSTRILLNSKSERHPNGMGNSSGLLGCYLSEHHMGPRGSGFIPTRIGTEPTLDDGRPTSPYIPRFRNVTDKHPDFIRGYHFQGGGGSYEYPGHAHDMPGFGRGWKSSVRKYYPAQFAIGGFGEVLPRKENRVALDAEVKDAWGIPVLRFTYRFSDNEIKMAKDMGDTAEEMLRAAGAENIQIDPTMLPPGWSIHEIGTARMGDDPKNSVTDRFCRLHDVPNVYMADAAPFVSGGTQNTTWSILAMGWRTMDHLKEAAGGVAGRTSRTSAMKRARAGESSRRGRAVARQDVSVGAPLGTRFGQAGSGRSDAPVTEAGPRCTPRPCPRSVRRPARPHPAAGRAFSMASSTAWLRTPSSKFGRRQLLPVHRLQQVEDGVGEGVLVPDDVPRRPPGLDVRVLGLGDQDAAEALLGRGRPSR